jgi:hypothetical protein
MTLPSLTIIFSASKCMSISFAKMIVAYSTITVFNTPIYA